MAPYDPASVLRADYLSWLRELAAAQPFGTRDRLGTLNHLDEKARRRATDAITGAGTADLARPLSYGSAQRRDGKPAFDLEVFYTDGPIGMGSDHLELDCHGLINTHVDGLNHLAIDGNWYGGWPVGDPDGPSIMDLVPGGIVARALHADIPAARGADWVDAQQPVSAQDIERALELGGATLEPGDALLLDMGRDRYEAAGHVYGGSPGIPRPGLGLSGARWIAEHHVSVLCWDFLDANHPDEPAITGHGLNWAIGLVLVDNCSFESLRAAAGRAEGALVFGVLPMAGATGCNVNPVVLL